MMDLVQRCDRCGECCRTQKIPFTILDIFDVSANLSMNPREFVEKYLETGTDNEREKMYLIKSTPCPFLENNQCRINSFKPSICRTTPCPKNRDYAEFKKKYRLMTLEFLINSPEDMIRHCLGAESTGDYLAAHKKFKERTALKYKKKIDAELNDRKHVMALLEKIMTIAVHPEFRDIITEKIRRYNA